MEPFIAPEVVVIRRVPLSLTHLVVPRLKHSHVREEFFMSTETLEATKAFQTLILE